MQFGLYHIGERAGRTPRDAWSDDLQEILDADRLGMQEAWLREHGGTNGPMPVPELFICKAAAMTIQIRLGPGGRHLPLHDPVDVAIEAAMCDVLTGGRYQFAYGLGGGAERANEDPAERIARMLEALELIVKGWTTDERFDFEGRYYQRKRVEVLPKPLQQPHMPIACASTVSEAIDVAGREGHLVLFADYDGPKSIREKTEQYLRAAAAAGRTGSREAMRICRYVYVTDSVDRARAEIRDTVRAEIEREKRSLQHHFSECMPPSGDVADISFDYLVDAGYYYVGDPDTVAGHIKRLWEETGGFGALLLRAGADRATREGRTRSMELFMRHVAPQLQDLTVATEASSAAQSRA
jgi:alkanesulfonate monooxygenase SsuD/methylene tetrahydromethanopterin reductase-like flavin-dependent oxidoreductase (luciferase family)